MYNLIDHYEDIHDCILRKYFTKGLEAINIFNSTDISTGISMLRMSFYVKNHRKSLQPTFVLVIPNQVKNNELEKTFNYVFTQIDKKLIELF